MDSRHFGVLLQSPMDRLQSKVPLLEAIVSEERAKVRELQDMVKHHIAATAEADQVVKAERARCIALADELAKVKATKGPEPIDQFYNRATIAELVRKLNERDHQLEAARARCAALEKRIKAGVAAGRGVLLGLGEMVR